MDNEIKNRWIEAGKIIALDANAKVLCPVCQKAYLQVSDVSNLNNPSKFERQMICNECGAFNALLMTKKDE